MGQKKAQYALNRGKRPGKETTMNEVTETVKEKDFLPRYRKWQALKFKAKRGDFQAIIDLGNFEKRYVNEDGQLVVSEFVMKVF